MRQEIRYYFNIETIKNLYKEAINDFFEKIKNIDVENMSSINIPAIGCEYENESLKIAIFGQDTNNSNRKEFGKLKDDYNNKRRNCEEIYDYLVEPFKSMTFVKDAEKNNFYGFVLKFLAEFHRDKLGFGWQGWDDLKKQKKYSSILQSFILGNINSFEIDKKIKDKNGVEKCKSEVYNIKKKLLV